MPGAEISFPGRPIMQGNPTPQDPLMVAALEALKKADRRLLLVTGRDPRTKRTRHLQG